MLPEEEDVLPDIRDRWFAVIEGAVLLFALLLKSNIAPVVDAGGFECGSKPFFASSYASASI